tara:strand:- start:14580 stop:15155 length:576 start_codon:yes stop_codon:yes gene_type:complete
MEEAANAGVATNTDVSIEPDLEEIMAQVEQNYVGDEEPAESGEAEMLSDPEDPLREQAQQELHQMRVLMDERKKYVEELLGKNDISSELMDQWKRQYKSVYSFIPNEEDLYLWRPVYKTEWDMIQRNFANKENAEQKMRETVVKRCVLFPKLTDATLSKSRAGLLDVLSNIIMEGSYFFSVERALQMVVEL